MSCGPSQNANVSADLKVSMSLYDSETGERIKTIDSLNFDKAMPNEWTNVKVIKMLVEGANQIANVKLCITASDPVVPNGSGTANTDGSVAAGDIGIEHSLVFAEKTILTSFFSGFNLAGLASNANNVSVGTSSETTSEFIYMNLKTHGSIGRGYVKFRWFFDFF
jgi:hypothetical protein